MAQPSPQDLEGREIRSIHIGGVLASRHPLVVRTVLGSCIAVCLRDPITGIGGMNHFMLPDSSTGARSPTSYGIHAMELLINKCMNLGAERSRLVAKVFGGGHVLRIRTANMSVSKANIGFTKKFLRTEGIPVVSHDVGGQAAREILFFTDSGRVLLRRFQETGLPEEIKAELVESVELPIVPPPTDDNVTLF